MVSLTTVHAASSLNMWLKGLGHHMDTFLRSLKLLSTFSTPLPVVFKLLVNVFKGARKHLAFDYLSNQAKNFF
jgi:hypothetical protein